MSEVERDWFPKALEMAALEGEKTVTKGAEEMAEEFLDR